MKENIDEIIKKMIGKCIEKKMKNYWKILKI